MGALWSDTGRRWKIAAAVAGMLAMGAYHAYLSLTVSVGWRDCVADPAGLDGSIHDFPLWVVSQIDSPTRYQISKIVQGVPVIGPTEGVTVGDTISVRARFDAAQQVMVELQREEHPLRRWKERLGVVGFVGMALLLPWAFRRRDGWIEERWRG